ncbi:MAG: hypothetical protein ACRD9R_17215 [Pyrinomonadaceae bacterium]
MNEEDATQNLTDGRSFEERVLARLEAIESGLRRLDQVEARLDGIEARLASLDEQAERRALETKPIWERALAEILEVKDGLMSVERKFDILTQDVIKVRADQSHLGRRLDKVESNPAR